MRRTQNSPYNSDKVNTSIILSLSVSILAAVYYFNQMQEYSFVMTELFVKESREERGFSVPLIIYKLFI